MSCTAEKAPSVRATQAPRGAFGAETTTVPSIAPAKTFYEHSDHQELPVGTKIYYIDGFKTIVRPGSRGPADRAPDIVVIP